MPVVISIDRWLVINIDPRVHLSSVSGSINKRLVVNVYSEAHLSPASLGMASVLSNKILA